MIIFKFGWSKPVPINEYNFEKRELYTGLTALAGPVSNLILASLTALLNQLFDFSNFPLIVFILYVFVTINIALAIFNLLPIPPLDGHKVVRALLPQKLRYYWEKLEKYSLILILLLVLPFSPLQKLTSSFIGNTLTTILQILGF